VGAVCGQAARTVLCGWRSVMGVPTAILKKVPVFSVHLIELHHPLRCENKRRRPKWDRAFESGLLQRRVHDPSVPPEISERHPDRSPRNPVADETSEISASRSRFWSLQVALAPTVIVYAPNIL